MIIVLKVGGLKKAGMRFYMVIPFRPNLYPRMYRGGDQPGKWNRSGFIEYRNRDWNIFLLSIPCESHDAEEIEEEDAHAMSLK